MKNILLYTALLAAALTTATGCEDWLDRTPPDSLSPDTFFSDRTECELYTNEFYLMFPGGSSIYNESADIILKDNLDEAVQGIRLVQTTAGTWNWERLRDINYFLKYSSNCSDEAVRLEYEGLARFFRAYFYYEKVKYYGDVPWVDTPLNYADGELYKGRDSREFVMQKMLEDIDFAIDNLPSAKSTYRVTRWTALALKTRFCLFEGTFRKYHGLDDYEKYLEECIEAGDEFIEDSGYAIYSVGSTAYLDLFASKTAVASEIILSRAYNATLSLTHDVNGYCTSSTMGKPGMMRNIANMYLMTNGQPYTSQTGWAAKTFVEECTGRDKRFAQTVRTPGYRRIGGTAQLAPQLDRSYSGYQLIKYVGEESYDAYGTSINDLPLFRTAEVYLNYAEAAAELGTLTQADIDRTIKPLRTRGGVADLDLADANANPDPYLASAETGYANVSGDNAGVILEIRRERTVELIMEGFRYWDIMRWKEGKRFEKPFTGMYFAAIPGEYDLDGNGTVDVCFYEDTAPDLGSSVVYIKTSEITLTEGTSGNILRFSDPSYARSWDENKDYLYPIPTEDRILTNGTITQNPGWDDGLGF